jgi:AraC family transcriptional regulator of arabinose operon
MSPDPRIQIVLEKLSTAGCSPVSVKELADSVQLSPSRFSHLFALATGLPPGEFLKRSRSLGLDGPNKNLSRGPS